MSTVQSPWELLVIEDCPHATPAASLLAEVLSEEGCGDRAARVEIIESQEDAQARGFIGSPSFFFDGVDLFAVPGATAAVACRTYATPSGLTGLPDRATLTAAVHARLATRLTAGSRRNVR